MKRFNRREFIKYSSMGMAVIVVGCGGGGGGGGAPPGNGGGGGGGGGGGNVAETLNFTITDAVKEMVTFEPTSPLPSDATCYFWVFREDRFPTDCPGPQIYATEGDLIRVNVTTGKTQFLYTPPADYTGPDSFRYLVQDTGGLISTFGVVSVMVEDLLVGRADYRSRSGRWQISGASSDFVGNSVSLYTGPRAVLIPDEEVPPVTSDARGWASLLIDQDSIDFRLMVNPLPATNVTAAHIHAGAPGVNGPVLFTLFQSSFQGDFPGEITGSLTSVNLDPRPEVGISTFAEAVEAILSGQAYINVHTTGEPAGEIRGQLGREALATVPVEVDGSWQFRGHAPLSPGPLPSVTAESANGVRQPGIPLRLR
ncbi:MAG: hypothetical protein Tsb0017_26080 [Geothermobacteraceae bacterium]